MEDPGKPRIIEILSTEKVKEERTQKATNKSQLLYIHNFAKAKLLSVLKRYALIFRIGTERQSCVYNKSDSEDGKRSSVGHAGSFLLLWPHGLDVTIIPRVTKGKVREAAP